MEIIKEVRVLEEKLKEIRSAGKTIGFTPTMGALHDGHLSLVSRSVEENDVSVCSIFVNPTQFNEKSDLDKYPKTLDADSAMLEKASVDFLFFPSPKEIYPNGESYEVDLPLDGMDEVLEGEFRPGHFKGVIQVVKRLLEITNPNHLYMGQKDFQQFSLIHAMITHFQMPTTLVVCPIKREPNGVAMSSRNVRLSKKGKLLASIIHWTLAESKKRLKNNTVKEVETWALENLTTEWCKVEYFKIVDGYTLKDIIDKKDHDYLVASLAVWIEDVRLIDNMTLKQ